MTDFPYDEERLKIDCGYRPIHVPFIFYCEDDTDKEAYNDLKDECSEISYTPEASEETTKMLQGKLDILRKVFTKHKKNKASDICFAHIMNLFKEYISNYDKLPDRLAFEFIIEPEFEKEYEKDEDGLKTIIIRYLDLCKRIGFIPEYMDTEVLFTTKTAVFDLNGLSIRHLYVYLSAVRFIQEYPAVLPNMLYLVEELNIDPYIAFVLTSNLCISSTVHNFITSSGYGQTLKQRLPKNPDYHIAPKLSFFIKEFKEDPLFIFSEELQNNGDSTPYQTMSFIGRLEAGNPEAKLGHKEVADKDKVAALYGDT